MKRTKRIVCLIMTAIVFGWATYSLAETKEEVIIRNSIEVLNDLSVIPEQGIPPALLKNAYGIAIIPSLLKAGFMCGGRYGKGILLIRNESKRWSNPSFIYIAGGSFGFQIGAQSTDIVLVFKTQKSIDSITSGKITLGVDISFAAGPVGRLVGAGTDILLKSEIYSYSRNRGFFIGISMEGAALRIHQSSNINFYKKPYISAIEIFSNKNLEAPIIASKLRQCLIHNTRQRN